MFKQQKLEDLIREKIPFDIQDSRGFYSLKCQCCNDYKVRSGFKFENNLVIFNCWNCSTAAVFEEFGEKISRKMRGVLNDFGIEDSEINLVINTAFFNQKEESAGILTLAALKKVNTNTPPTSLPAQSFKLGAIDEHLDSQVAIAEYLHDRKIDLGKYNFFFSTLPRFKNRVIIPFYRNGELIYWQARSIDPLEKKRYDNCVVSRDAVIFNSDQLGTFTPAPLLVSEGVFDALMFNGIAVLGSKLSDAKLTLLNNSKRRLVFLIDKDKNGAGLAEAVLACGWEITFTPNGSSDLNNSVQRFGYAWTAQQIMKNIPENSDAARLALEINCK